MSYRRTNQSHKPQPQHLKIFIYRFVWRTIEPHKFFTTYWPSLLDAYMIWEESGCDILMLSFICRLWTSVTAEKQPIFKTKLTRLAGWQCLHIMSETLWSVVTLNGNGKIALSSNFNFKQNAAQNRMLWHHSFIVFPCSLV